MLTLEICIFQIVFVLLWVSKLLNLFTHLSDFAGILSKICLYSFLPPSYTYYVFCIEFVNVKPYCSVTPSSYAKQDRFVEASFLCILFFFLCFAQIFFSDFWPRQRYVKTWVICLDCTHVRRLLSPSTAMICIHNQIESYCLDTCFANSFFCLLTFCCRISEKQISFVL